jgi:hypothetical protein
MHPFCRIALRREYPANPIFLREDFLKPDEREEDTLCRLFTRSSRPEPISARKVPKKIQAKRKM